MHLELCRKKYRFELVVIWFFCSSGSFGNTFLPEFILGSILDEFSLPFCKQKLGGGMNFLKFVKRLRLSSVKESLIDVTTTPFVHEI